jgi:hypothetical protein
MAGAKTGTIENFKKIGRLQRCADLASKLLLPHRREFATGGEFADDHQG